MHKGFTLLEILVVLGLIGVIASFSVSQGLSSFGRTLERISAEETESLARAAKGKMIRHICDSVPCPNDEWR